MSVWNLLYKELTGTHDYIKPNTPATQKQIAEVEKVLDCKGDADTVPDYVHSGHWPDTIWHYPGRNRRHSPLQLPGQASGLCWT